MKTCSKCGDLKPLSAYWKRKASRDGLNAQCKDCMKAAECRRPERVRNVYRENPEAHLRRVRKYQARRKYNVPEHMVEDVLHRAEHGTCEIYGKAAPTDAYHKRHHIDHDHKTGEYRGILCKDCNRMLGSARDDPEILRRAVAYLEERAGRVY